MKASRFFVALLTLTLLGFGACGRKTTVVVVQSPTPEERPVARTSTFETQRLSRSIDLFESDPTAANRASTKKAFAELDGEIAELQERVAKVTGGDRDESALKLRNLESFRTAESARFTKAEAKSSLTPGPADGRTGSEKLDDASRRTGDRIEEGAKKAGDAIEGAAKATGDAIKDVVR